MRSRSQAELPQKERGVTGNGTTKTVQPITSEKLVRLLPARLELALTWANQMSILTLLWRKL